MIVIDVEMYSRKVDFMSSARNSCYLQTHMYQV